MLRPSAVLVSAGAVWTALVVTAPLLGWSFIYAAAHLVCHQIPPRSFHIASGQLAVCARCLGLYVGAVSAGSAALAWAPVGGSTTAAPARRFLVAAALPTAFTIAAEWSGWVIGNPTRFAAALPLGAAAGWLVVRALEVDWRA